MFVRSFYEIDRAEVDRKTSIVAKQGKPHQAAATFTAHRTDDPADVFGVERHV
jgi:hypothetical protein